MRKILLVIGLIVLATPAFAGGTETVENDVVVIRGGSPTFSETIENGVVVVRGTSDYPVYEIEVVEETQSTPDIATQFFMAYDQWLHQSIHRRIYPRP